MNRIKTSVMGAAFVCLLCLAAILGSAGAQVGHAQVPPTPNDWQSVPGAPSDVDFRNVFMASGTAGSGIAVGKQANKGVAFDLDWVALDGWRNQLNLSPENFSFRAPLRAGVIVNEDEWVVGEQGLIAHKHNGIWSEVPNPVPDAQLLTLQMLGNGEEGWAGGFRPVSGGGQPEPVLLHYTKGQWQRDGSITGSGTINALHFAQGGGWAVGNAGIWRYHNNEWTKEQEPNPCPETGCFETYSAVRAISADEAWIAGDRIGLCGICVPNPYILHRVGGKWQIALDGNVAGDPTREGVGRSLYGLTFSESGTTAWAVGEALDGPDPIPYIITHSSSQPPSQWTYMNYPAGVKSQLTSISTIDNSSGGTHAVAVGTNGVILSYGYGQQPPPTLTPTPGGTVTSNPTPTPTAPSGSNPTARVEDPHDPAVSYFSVVGHTLRGGFKDYWLSHGGLAQFGYPLTEEFVEVSPTDGKPYTTQYFERARFEYHPENQPPYNVLLGLLGRTITQGRENETPFKRTPAMTGPGVMYFGETGHNMPPQLAGYWQSHGGLPVYGYPISEAFQEVSPTDGKPYLVQYFERNRLEYHPQLSEAYRVSLGLLGVQILQQRGWIK